MINRLKFGEINQGKTIIEPTSGNTGGRGDDRFLKGMT